MIDVKDLNILNQKYCRCGYYEFSLSDVKSVEPLQDAHGFYGNLVKHYARVICTECGKEIILLLKQVGQTWGIMNSAISRNAPNKTQDAAMLLTEQTRIKNGEDKIQNNEFICPECKKICKSKIGLNAHMKTHQK